MGFSFGGDLTALPKVHEKGITIATFFFFYYYFFKCCVIFNGVEQDRKHGLQSLKEKKKILIYFKDQVDRIVHVSIDCKHLFLQMNFE